jgi:hypothetical protein
MCAQTSVVVLCTGKGLDRTPTIDGPGRQAPEADIAPSNSGTVWVGIDAPNRQTSVTEWTAAQDSESGTFAETAGAMKNLDLVITVDTAVAHLAGALAVPVWVALSAVVDWRWLLKRSDTPWYPTMRLFRQETLGAWEPVFARMAEEGRTLVARRAGGPVRFEVSGG